MNGVILEERKSSRGWIYQQLKISTGGNLMEYIKEVNINEAIIHVLDVNAEEPVLNNYILTLNENNYKFILDIIHKCLKRDDLKYAKFEKATTPDIANKINDYFNGKTKIVELSQNIAEKLFARMKEFGPSGDLIVVSISTEYGPLVAVLKLDYKENFKHDIAFIDDNIAVDLSAIKILPKNKKINVAAFIKPQKKDNQFDLMIINDVSNKWFKEALEYIEIANERDQTKRLINITEQFARRIDKAADAENLRKVLRYELKNNDVVDIKDISEKVFAEDAELKEQFEIFAAEHQVNEKIELDKQYIEHKKRYISLKIDTDMQLKISQEAYDDLSRFQVVKNEDGTINILLKNISHYLEK